MDLSPATLVNWLATNGPDYVIKIVTAVLVWIVGKWVAKKIRGVVQRLTEGKIDVSLQRFVCSLVYGLLLAVVAIAALERLGVKTTGLIAILGAAGLAIGMALQGSLGNFASGVLIILFRPYKIGDLVDIAGQVGVVEAVEIFNTTIVTPDNKTVIIPNGKVTSDVITNISTKGTIRVDIEVGVGYGDNLDKAKDVMMGILKADTRVLSEPAPTVAVSNLGGSSVDFVVRPWCHPDHYWDVRFDTIKNIKEALDKNGISIPYPQQEVYVKELARSA